MSGVLVIKKSLGREMLRAVQAVKPSSNDSNIQAEERMIAMVGPIIKYLYFSGSIAALDAYNNALAAAAAAVNYGDKLTVVSQNGGGSYTTITSAIAAVTDATLNNPVTLLILPGKYCETLTLKDHVNLIGVDPNACIITSSTGIPLSATTGQEVRIENLTIFQTGTSSAVTIEGASTFKSFLTFKNCRIGAKSPTDGTINAFGGGINLYDSIITSSGSYAVNIYSAGGTGYPYSQLLLKDVYVSGSKAAVRYNNHNTNTNVYLQNSYLYAGAGPAVWYQANGNIKIDNCRLESVFREAITVATGTTAAKFNIANSRVTCVSGSTTNLVGLVSGTGTIGFYNNVINSDNKPAGLAINTNTPAKWYGSTNATLGYVEHIYWEDVRVSGHSVKKAATNTPTAGAFMTTLLIDWFSASALNEVFFTVQLPHSYKQGSNLKPHVHWTPSSTHTGQVDWFLDYSWQNAEGGVFPAVDTVTLSDNGGGTAYAHLLTASGTIVGTGKTISSMLACRLYRDGGSGNDTFTGTAGLLEFDLHYQINRIGSNTELVK